MQYGAGLKPDKARTITGVSHDHDEIDWDDLRYFLRAASASTLAGAARNMGVEHSTIGRRLAALERKLGTALVLRNPDGLKLTPIGEKVLPLVENMDRIVRSIDEAVRSQKVRVRLAVPSGFTKFFTGPGLAKLRVEHPEIELEIISGSKPVDLTKGEADLSLRSGPIVVGPTDDTNNNKHNEGDELVVRKVGESSFSLFASDAYLARHPAFDLADLSGHELIGYDASLAAVPAAKWIEDRAAAPAVAIVLRSREMVDMAAAAASGVGIAALPCMIGDDDPGLRRLTNEIIATRNIALVYRREAKLSDQVRAVIDFVVEMMHNAAPKMRGGAAVLSDGQRS
jgi:DNA-binding transcriptional LysR family regulator